MAGDIDVGGGVFKLSELAVALNKIGSKLPAYEKRVLAEDEG